jgi:hypothetical protein
MMTEIELMRRIKKPYALAFCEGLEAFRRERRRPFGTLIPMWMIDDIRDDAGLAPMQTSCQKASGALAKWSRWLRLNLPDVWGEYAPALKWAYQVVKGCASS